MDAIIARTWNLVDRSLTPVKISPLSNTVPSTIDTRYSVELADGKVIGIDTIIEDCELNFLNHLFKIDLIPIEPGSFDVIISMNWLTRYHATIIRDKNIVRIPLGDETLTTRSNRSNGYASIIYEAQVESLKTENVKDENLHGMDKELRLVLIELPALGAGVGYHALET
ncbi:putative reverse transcriptase domain-containing protein [Tanacetum coccineum]